MNTTWKKNSLFKQGQDDDSKDFMIYILAQLHTELKKQWIKIKMGIKM